MALFDTLLATAASLQKSLTNGTLKSAQIVEEYHRAYNKYNGYLNAVYQLAPGAMARAKEMDNLRAQGSVLGPLHGIPIILKVSICLVRINSAAKVQ
jgi:amidase